MGGGRCPGRPRRFNVGCCCRCLFMDPRSSLDRVGLATSLVGMNLPKSTCESSTEAHRMVTFIYDKAEVRSLLIAV
jgi:hypothetical protein